MFNEVSELREANHPHDLDRDFQDKDNFAYDYGRLEGRLEALRWCLGEDWGCLDT
jgi:hypothetical protein